MRGGKRRREEKRKSHRERRGQGKKERWERDGKGGGHVCQTSCEELALEVHRG